jgi:hypothetical protein
MTTTVHILLFLLTPIFAAQDWVIVSNGNSSVCSSTSCVLLLSQSENEIIGEFTYAPGNLRQGDAPYELVSDSLLTSLVKPSFSRPRISGTFRVDTDTDGWYAASPPDSCYYTDFQGTMIFDSVSQTCADPEDTRYACACPLTEEEIEEEPSLKLQRWDFAYSIGKSLGFQSLAFYVYREGYYMLSSAYNRTLAYMNSENNVSSFEFIESVDFDKNYTFIQITNGSVEHQAGAEFYYAESNLTIPWRSIWEFVGENLTFIGSRTCGPVWCAYWLDANESVSVQNASTYFVRDILSNNIS